MRDLRRRAEDLVRNELSRAPYLFIGGLDVESEGQHTLPLTNPATGSPVGRTPAANAKDVDRAAKAAASAYDDARTHENPQERSKTLWALAEAIENDDEDLCLLESMQTGHSYAEVKNSSVPEAVKIVRQIAGWVDRISGETHTLAPDRLGFTFDEGLPVVAAIYDETAPLAVAIRKIACALATGCSLILRPPEGAPSSTLRLAQLLHEIGLAPGRVNVVTGGARTAEHMAECARIHSISFSGPIETARRLLVGSAKSNLKPVHFEIGSKTSCIVFKDGDSRKAIDGIANRLFGAQYSHFTTPTRLLVHEDLYEDVAAAIVGRAKAVVVGNPLDEHTQLGPMTSAAHLDRVLAYVELGRREGAKLVAGGRADTEGSKSNGAFVLPTVLMGASPDMRVFREDIRGPVLCIGSFSKEEQAVALANATNYASGAAVFTRDVGRAHRLARRLEAGAVWINEMGSLDPSLGVGGWNLAGMGNDLGPRGLAQMTRSRRVSLKLS